MIMTATRGKGCAKATSRQNKDNKLVQGVWRPWYWGTKYARDQDISDSQIQSWCRQAGVTHRVGEDIVEVMHRIDLATKMRKELSVPKKESAVNRWIALIKSLLSR